MLPFLHSPRLTTYTIALVIRELRAEGVLPQRKRRKDARWAEVSPVDVSPVTNEEAPPPPPPAKKTRARKKAEPKAADTAEPGNMERTEAGGMAPFALPKRGRKKKTVDEAEATVNMEVKISPESTDPAPQAPTDASAGTPPAKPKRTRRVGEPKPKRYPVGEKDPEQGM